MQLRVFLCVFTDLWFEAPSGRKVGWLYPRCLALKTWGPLRIFGVFLVIVVKCTPRTEIYPKRSRHRISLRIKMVWWPRFLE